MTFPLQRGDYLSLFDRLDTSVANVIDAKKDPDLLRKATGFLSRNPNCEELLIRVSDEFEVPAFSQDSAPNRFWNIKAFSTIPPVTNLLQQRAQIEQVVFQNGSGIKHEYEVLRVRKVHEIATPIRVQLEQVIVSERHILLTTQDPLAGLISSKDIIRISGVHPILDSRHLIDEIDQCKLKAENTTSISSSVLDVNSHDYCAMEATLDNSTVIYRIRRKQYEGSLSMSPVLYDEGRFQELRARSLLTPCTPSGEDASYSPADTRRQGESSEGQSCGGRGTPHEILLLPKCEKHPELQEKIRQITAPVFIENLVNEVGLKSILRVCKDHLFGLKETKEAFEAAVEEIEAEKRLLKSEQNEGIFQHTSGDLRTKESTILLEKARERFDDTSGNLETKNSVVGLRKSQETTNHGSENVKTNRQLIGSKETETAIHDSNAALDMEEYLSQFDEVNEAFDDLPDEASCDLDEHVFDDLPDDNLCDLNHDGLYDLHDDEYGQLDNEEHYFEKEDVNEGFDDEDFEDYEIASPAPVPKPAPVTVSSSMLAVSRANRLLGITPSTTLPPATKSLLGNKATSTANRRTPPPPSNKVFAIDGLTRSRSLSPLKSRTSHSFEEIVHIIRGGIRTRQTRTLCLCHERSDAVEIQARFIEYGIDAILRKRGKLNALTFHREVAGCFVLIVNVQVALNLMEDMDEDLFSFFAYIVSC